MEEFHQDPALVQAFLVESREFLQSMDQDLVELENAPGNEELLNRIFRALHTIKGTAGFFGFYPIVQLGHRAEDVLSALRRRDIHVVPRVMTALLAARDRLGDMVTDLGAGGLKSQYEIEGLLAELDLVQNNGGALLETADASRVEPSQGLAPTSNRDDAASVLRKSVGAGQTMRVDVRKLDELINLIGELVLERNRILQLAKELSSGTNTVDSPLPKMAS
jgi:two-component system chemotaxis sensor kinase CheA